MSGEPLMQLADQREAYLDRQRSNSLQMSLNSVSAGCNYTMIHSTGYTHLDGRALNAYFTLVGIERQAGRIRYFNDRVGDIVRSIDALLDKYIVACSDASEVNASVRQHAEGQLRYYLREQTRTLENLLGLCTPGAGNNNGWWDKSLPATRVLDLWNRERSAYTEQKLTNEKICIDDVTAMFERITAMGAQLGVTMPQGGFVPFASVAALARHFAVEEDRWEALHGRMRDINTHLNTIANK
jgi:hypothetical protein